MSSSGQSKEKPRIIVKRKKVSGGGHHGGSWKVAYADFVTAMMAFFMVLWIVGLGDEHRSAVESYFNDPFGREGQPAGAMVSMGSAPGGQISLVPLIASDAMQKEAFEQAKARIESALSEISEFAGMREFVEVRITDEGLVIDLLDSEESFFFESSSAEVKSRAQELFGVIAIELAELPNPIVFEGHTDATPFRTGQPYTNWELSADRANAVRRVMVSRALRPNQVSEVRGYGPRQLRDTEQPGHFSNRRVSILARYIAEPAD